jgi:SAM-dependent methyltransferase
MDKNKSAKERSKTVWGASPASSRFASDLHPGTKEFFDVTIKLRNETEIPFIMELIPFPSFHEKEVLELGCGAGYDAYEFIRNGAEYTGIDITPENIERTKKHLAFYGYIPKVFVGDAEDLEFMEGSFDIVFSNGVLHHTPNIAASFQEAYRVLKSGGEFWVILYHKNSIFYWLSLMLFDHVLKFGFLKRSFKERLSMIEYTTSDELPLVNVYSKSQLNDLLIRNRFRVEEIWVRRLIRDELPAFPILGRLLRKIPSKWLDSVGHYFGWYIIAKSKKQE